MPAAALSAVQRGARDRHHTPDNLSREPHAHQVRGHRQERQVAQARQREPLLQPLRGDPLRRAPAQQVLAQGRDGLQPRAEWAGSLALAERSASRWRKEPDVETIEIVEARKVKADATV